MRTCKGWLSAALSGCCAPRRSRGAEAAAVVDVVERGHRAARSSIGASARVGRRAPIRPSRSSCPAAIKSKGTLTVAADASYAPDEFIGLRRPHRDRDGRRPGKALGGVMGLKVNVVNATFDSDHPRPGRRQVRHGRLVVHRHQGAREDRRLRRLLQRRRVVLHQGVSGGTTISELADICGKTVAVEKGTTEETDATDAERASARRPARPASRCSSFPDQNGANLALSAAARSSASPTRRSPPTRSRSRTASSSSSARRYATAPYGLAMPKSSGLDKAVLAALKVLMQQRHLHAILTKWGLQARRDPGLAGEDQRRDAS